MYFRVLRWLLAVAGVLGSIRIAMYYAQCWNSLHEQGVSTLALSIGLIATIVTSLFAWPLALCFLGFFIALKVDPNKPKKIEFLTSIGATILGYSLALLAVSNYFIAVAWLYFKAST